MSTLEKMKCGEIPVIPNGEVSDVQKPYKKDERVQIRCNKGSKAQVSYLTCQEGEWSSGELMLEEICKRTSLVDRTNTTHKHDGPFLSIIYCCVFVPL